MEHVHACVLLNISCNQTMQLSYITLNGGISLKSSWATNQRSGKLVGLLLRIVRIRAQCGTLYNYTVFRLYAKFVLCLMTRVIDSLLKLVMRQEGRSMTLNEPASLVGHISSNDHDKAYRLHTSTNATKRHKI